MTQHLRYVGRLHEGLHQVLAPAGIATPHGSSTLRPVDGAEATPLTELATGQPAMALTLAGPDLSLGIDWDPSKTAPYPEAMFHPIPSRFTRFADDLVQEVRDQMADTPHDDLPRAIACHTAERFTYGHPEDRFYDGHDEVPALGCGLTEGSCVDINTYFVAALRAMGVEAGYITGYFFPQERGGTCADGHCWVVTRHNGAVQEWDIAHHLKMGTRDIRPALNPKPGARVACFHSMGLAFPELGITELKALIEPVAVHEGRAIPFDTPQINLDPADAMA